ncbi:MULTISPECIES: hypothetical protein [Pseudomonas]|uniref:Uncharacterized protein n=1 Tax=Pseudomonas cedrina TaxID=651740 RepID=A0A2S9E2C8_PSECE|nr:MULTISPECIES: hypothetical protein [Pseudomonas]AVJ21012.1 hypothetical protein CLM72_04375 [Pseudomonas sp. MYb193]PRC08991.1 hypothetical protein CQ006_04580 [Pseudomonas cedrina]
MTVSTISSVAEFVTNGVTTNYPFYFKFLANEDLAVTYINPDGVSALLILGTHYTVNGAGDDDGGSIVTNTALAGPGQLVVSREMDPFQQTSLRNHGKFLAETHEDVFDRLTMLIQQGFSIFKRALTRPFGRDYFFAENRRITSVKDPEDIQDAATRGWTARFFADLIDQVTGIINTTTGIFYDSGTLFDYLRFGNSRTVDNIAALRLLSASRNQRVIVLGYYARGDYTPVHYSVDPLDITTADDGFATIVGLDGARWKLAFAGYIDVRWAGAVPDDTTDSYLAIQKCITYAGAKGISRVCVYGKYVITDTLVVDFASYFKGILIEGGSALIDQIRQIGNNKDAFWWSTTQYLRNSTIRNLGIYCMANAGHGVNIKLGCALNRFIDVNVTVLNPTKSTYTGIWSGIGLGQPQGVFDTTWEGGDLYITNAHTAFGIDFVTNGTTFNENNFRRMRWNNGNVRQFARFSNVDTGSYLEGNTIDGINFEICSGGGVFVTNAKGWKISTLSFWDHGGSYNDHLVHFGVNSGLESVNNVVELVKRNGDAMAAGKRDIYIEGAQDTTLINCYTDPANGASYDFNNKRVSIIGPQLSGATNTVYTSYVNSNHSVTASASFNGTTAVASAAYNIGSIVRSAAGLYRVTFTGARTNTNYQVHMMLSSEVLTIGQVSKTLNYFDIKVSLPGGANQDMVNIDFKVFG